MIFIELHMKQMTTQHFLFQRNVFMDLNIQLYCYGKCIRTSLHLRFYSWLLREFHSLFFSRTYSILTSMHLCRTKQTYVMKFVSENRRPHSFMQRL